jgi:hypothetical protein
MLPVDYSAGIGFIEEFMIDTCIITRDWQQTRDDTLPEMSLTLSKPVSDSDKIYEGKCSIGRAGSPANKSLDGLDLDQPNYKILIPLSAPLIRVNDRISVTASVNDPTLVRKFIRVVHVEALTHKVYKAIWGRDETNLPMGD